MKVLFCCSEAYPLAKTGGLGDVAGALPRALLKKGIQVRLLIPAYASALAKAKPNGLKVIAQFDIDGQPVKIWQSRLPGSRVTVWLVDHETFSARGGGLYGDEHGDDWHDNAWRYYLFSKAAELIALNEAELDWQADIVHCNDWQAGLIPALLAEHEQRPKTAFTIHNLAYRGLFDRATFDALKLPPHWWHHEALEFWGDVSFLKAGLVFSDIITTVSPSYAEEIQTPEYGCGLDGLLKYRRADLIGIVNGIDEKTWNPGADPHLHASYNRRSLGKKQQNKVFLQDALGLAQNRDALVFGFVGRLVEQKGLTIMLPALDEFLSRTDCQLAAVGTGQPELERALLQLAEKFPGRVSATIGYSEALSHQIEAGCDAFLMPSLFEPCGLNQMYSQRYGALPVCHFVGGLRDTVINLSDTQLNGYISGSLNTDSIDETGFLFRQPNTASLLQTLDKVLLCYQQKALWKQLQLNGMSKDFSWETSAESYIALFGHLLAPAEESERLTG